jgi:CubicO group peptidase (beta-lactamase class C family)
MAQDHRVRDTVAAVLRPYADDVTTWASGSLFSSASELARLAVAIMDRGRVDGAQAVPAAAVATLVEPRAPVPGGEGCRYAYGLSACVRGGVRTLSHYGFRVGSGSVVTMAPDSQAAVIVLANRNGGILAGTAAAVMAQLVGAAGADVAARPDSAPRAPIDARRFVGRYANGRDTVQVLQRPTGLAYRHGADESPARLDDAGALLVLDAKGEPVQRWVLVAGAASRTPYLHDGLNAFARVR